LSGYDLNRKWGIGITEWAKARVPEVYGMRTLFERSIQTREVALFCDLHGHNRKHGVFIYGCHTENYVPTAAPSSENQSSSHDSQGMETTGGLSKKFQERVFPLLLSRLSGSLFQFRRCQFRMQKSKQGTGRITVRKHYNILNSFTLEASFCGTDTSPSGGFFYSATDLEKVGENIGRSLYEYYKKDDDNPKPAGEVQGKEGGQIVGAGESQMASEIHEEILRGLELGNMALEPEDRLVGRNGRNMLTRHSLAPTNINKFPAALRIQHQMTKNFGLPDQSRKK
jgi:ribosomal protein L24E